VGHFVRHQTTIPTSSGVLGLPLMVQHATPVSLGCWVLIILALFFCFQHDDHLTLLDAVAHVKTGTYPF
jgi:hypothetical protein